MSLQKYTALLKTVELGSISLAARQMGYTQPAVSRMIADLEREWNVELLRRSRAGLEPSSVCLKLMPILRAIQEDCDALNFSIAEIHEAHEGFIRVGVFTSVADVWLPRLLKSFQEQYPNIRFELVDIYSYAEVEDCIYRGKVDCGFVTLPTGKELNCQFLMRDELVAVLPPDHPLADASVFPISQLEGAPFIKFHEEDDFEVSRFLNRISYKPDLHYEVGSDHTLLSMVESGLGIAISHALLADNPRYNVVYKPFDVTQYRDIAIATAKNGNVASTTKLFIDHITSHITAQQSHKVD